MIYRYSLIVSLFILSSLCFQSWGQDNVVIENAQMRLEIGADGIAKSLIHKDSGEECLINGSNVPLCSLTQYRPYDNENFLMFPAKPRVFPANKIERIGDTLRVEFRDTYDIAFIAMKITDQYIGFELSRIDYRIEDFGVKRKTEIDEFTLLQLPVKKRDNFGEWLNVNWDNKVAVNVLATAPTTRIDAYPLDGGFTMMAGLDYSVKMFNSGVALITTSPNKLLDCIDHVEHDYKMPLGVESRRRKEYPYSYYELRDVTTKNIDENIALAKQGGFKTMVVYYVDFAKACGHFEWRDEYPNGINDLKEICDKIKAAGMIPGLHMHYSKIATNDPYINNGIPDSRTNVVREMILSKPISASDSEIFIESNPEGLRMENGRRLIQIGNELIMYSGYSSSRPYKLTGCERGVYNSKVASHDKGEFARLLDVDDWPLFIRVNQNADIQQEIAQRLGKIYHDAGFRFVYFDGAEDVPMPYWYNVSRSQLTVYNQLSPAPLYAEGALKSHYGWHILTRGNAFDIFPPERIRPAMKKYTLRCASQIAKDFTSVNFGWVNYLAPSEKTMGMQPDMFEYICSKALAWNSPISLVANIPEIKKHPRTADNFKVMKLWEEAKINKAFNNEQKEILKNADKEFLLLRDAKGQYNIYESKLLEMPSSSLIRAFSFERNGKTCIVYWNRSGNCRMALNVSKRNIKLTDTEGHSVKVSETNNKSIIPLANRLIIESNLSVAEISELLQNATIIDNN